MKISIALVLLSGVLGLRVLSPDGLQGYRSSPVFRSYAYYPQYFSFSNVSLRNAGFISTCSLENVPVPSSPGQVLYFADSNCFPEDVAFLAHERGFIGAIKKSSFVVPGISAVFNWKSDNAPIPMLLVGRHETPELWERVDFFPTTNWLLEQPVAGLLTFAVVIHCLVMIPQIIVCAVIFSVIVKRDSSVKWYKNVPLMVSILTFISCCAGVMEMVDYQGIWHITNVPFKSWISTIVFESVIWINLLLGFSLYNAIADANSASHLGYVPRVIMISWCVLTLFVDITSSYYTSIGIEQEQLLAARTFFYFVVLSISTVFFYRSKKQVLKVFAAVQGMTMDKKVKLKISTTFLHLNSFFCATFLVSSLFYAGLLLLGSNWIMLFNTLGTLSLRISSFFQILSVSPQSSQNFFLKWTRLSTMRENSKASGKLGSGLNRASKQREGSRNSKQSATVPTSPKAGGAESV